MAKLWSGLVVVGLMLLTAACAAPAETPSATPSPRLTPYFTPSQTARPSLASPTVEPIPSPGPTATPLTHAVAENETLIGIALRYGITLDELLAANPGINPRLLSIGQTLIIPGPGGQLLQALAPTPTPVALVYSPVACYRTASDGLWCLTTARNPTVSPVEGVGVLVTLLDPEGQPMATEPGEAPLNLLPAGGSLPLAAYFAPPAPEASSAVAQAVSGVAVADITARYLPVSVEREAQVPGGERQSWHVRGTLTLGAGAGAAATRARVVLVALNEDGEAVGFSTWDAEAEIAPGGESEFEMVVFSLGPAIDRVEILAEAQPAS